MIIYYLYNEAVSPTIVYRERLSALKSYFRHYDNIACGPRLYFPLLIVNWGTWYMSIVLS